MLRLYRFQVFFIKLFNYFRRTPVCHTITISCLTVAISALYHHPPFELRNVVHSVFHSGVYPLRTKPANMSQIHLCGANPSALLFHYPFSQSTRLKTVSVITPLLIPSRTVTCMFYFATKNDFVPNHPSESHTECTRRKCTSVNGKVVVKSTQTFLLENIHFDRYHVFLLGRR